LVRVTYLPFELHPEAPPEGIPYETYFGSARSLQVRSYLQTVAEQVGLKMQSRGVIINSRRALGAAEYAREQGKFDEMHHALFKAHWEETGRLENVDDLVRIGTAAGLDPAQNADLDAWDAMVDTNVKGLMYVTRAVLPGMVARNRGLIINLGSTAATYPYPGGNVYGATKAFVRQFSLNLRADLLGTKVRITDVEPGLVGGTEFSTVRFRGDRAKAAKLYEGADALTPEDIAETIHWIATLPPRVNVNTIELMPVTQAFGPLVVHHEDRSAEILERS